MNNEDESVHCDQDDGESWEEDAAGLSGPDQLAEVLHVLAQGPILLSLLLLLLLIFIIIIIIIIIRVQYWQQQECNISR